MTNWTDKITFHFDVVIRWDGEYILLEFLEAISFELFSELNLLNSKPGFSIRRMEGNNYRIYIPHFLCYYSTSKELQALLESHKLRVALVAIK